MIKSYLKHLIYKKFNISFAKSGEDIQLKQLLKLNHQGFYVDIGCWDPIKASNTYYFYLRGWQGICIDPNPNLQQSYKKLRPNDIFVHAAIGLDNQSLDYYQLQSAYNSMNSLDATFIKEHQLQDKLIEKNTIQTKTLKAVLDLHLKKNQTIDFFDVDTEGFDLAVLQSNDWDLYRPKIVLVETNLSLLQETQSSLTQFLDTVGYELIGKSVINHPLGNLFFKDKNWV